MANILQGGKYCCKNRQNPKNKERLRLVRMQGTGGHPYISRRNLNQLLEQEQTLLVLLKPQ